MLDTLLTPMSSTRSVEEEITGSQFFINFLNQLESFFIVFITNINKPANDKIAPNKWVNPFIGSLIYLPIFITVTENL